MHTPNPLPAGNSCLCVPMLLARADYLAGRAARGLTTDLRQLATTAVAVASVPSTVVPSAHRAVLERAIPALLLPYVDGPIPGDNFLSDYCRFCWDIQGVPGADTVLKYMGQVVKFVNRHLGILMTPPAVLVDALKRQRQDPVGRPIKQPCPVELIAAVVYDEEVPLGTRLALVLLWFGGFRGGDIMSPRVLDFDEQFCLRRMDCTVAPDRSSITLYLRKAKADVRNRGGHRFIQAAPAGAALCPVQFLMQYLDATKDTPEHFPLLMHTRRSDEPWRCVTRAHVTAALQRAAERLGIAKEGVGCHAVRTGHATALLAAPFVTSSDRQQSGGWVSEMGSLPYHRVNGPAQRRVADALALTHDAVRVGTGVASGWAASGSFGVAGLHLRVSSRGR
jgi:integrase